MNYKGVGTTITWVPALFVILFFSLVFIASLLVLRSDDVLFGRKNIQVDFGATHSDYYIQRGLIDFLDTTIIYEDRELPMRRFIEEQDIRSSTPSRVFEEYAQPVLDELFPNPENLHFVRSYWLGVFERDEEIDRDGREYFMVGEDTCTNYKNWDLIYVVPLDGKKLVLCANEGALRTLEGRHG